MQWQVLAVEKGKALVISKHALDCQPLDKKNANVTWEKSWLRQSLNSTFLTTAFTKEEQAGILSTKVAAVGNSGSATTDKIFILSLSEANKYGLKYRTPTKFALARGAKTYEYAVEGSKITTWLLRDPKTYTGFVSSTYYGGKVGICPAMWVTVTTK